MEEAAQRLYKEWFVDLRFPGHETTPITDGIPKGWAEGTIQDLVIYHDKRRKPLVVSIQIHATTYYITWYDGRRRLYPVFVIHDLPGQQRSFPL